MSSKQQQQQKQNQQNRQGKQNDYCQNFVNQNERPQNFIMNIKPSERFVDYPQLQELMVFKDQLIAKRNHPTQFIKQDLKQFDLTQLGKFDVILMDPPWREYEERVQDLPIFQENPKKFKQWSLDEISSLPIPQISETPSFLFLWVGSEHLDDGRELFKRWGFKRCEDIVWAKTNKESTDRKPPIKPGQILQRVKEHCLVGLRGDVKRAGGNKKQTVYGNDLSNNKSDSHFIHANIDTDVIVDEEPEVGSLKKPTELYSIIERFCLGRKKLELFGELHNIRDGWLTVGQDLPSTNFQPKAYNAYFEEDPYIQEQAQKSIMTNTHPSAHLFNYYPSYQGGRYIGTTPEIEARRPKSPPKNLQAQSSGNSNQTRSQMFQQALQKQYNQHQINTPFTFNITRESLIGKTKEQIDEINKQQQQQQLQHQQQQQQMQQNGNNNNSNGNMHMNSNGNMNNNSNGNMNIMGMQRQYSQQSQGYQQDNNSINGQQQQQQQYQENNQNYQQQGQQNYGNQNSNLNDYYNQ